MTGGDISCYPELLAQAKELSEYSESVRKALCGSGILPPQRDEEQEIRRKLEKVRKKATTTIFGAIRRNDIKAVEAILEKQPDLTAKNNDGQTAVEYARLLGREDAFSLIQSVQREV
jgi:NifB/MoaA-like Fe-S oxidoreductase